MPIEATSPSNVSAVYNLWAYEFQTVGTGLLPYGSELKAQPPIRAIVTMTKYRVRGDGVREQSPLPEDREVVIVDDLYALAATNANVAAALQSNLVAVAEIAAAQGKL